MPIFHADNENQFYLAIRLAVLAWQRFKVKISFTFEAVKKRAGIWIYEVLLLHVLQGAGIRIYVVLLPHNFSLMVAAHF
jgi:hypothetical protein